MDNKQRLDYQHLSAWWSQLNDEVDIGEVQAGICALLCLKPQSSTEELFEALGAIYQLEVNEQSTALVDYVRDNSVQALGSWDFSLRLLLPQVEEVEDVVQRFRNLREWCQAYSTFFLLNAAQGEHDELTQDALTSINKIASFDSRRVQHDERDGELSLVQLEESVRTAVMTIFAELQSSAHG